MKLKKYLKAAQALQAKAIDRKDIHLFEIDVRNHNDGDTSLWVTAKLLKEEGYNYFSFYTFLNKEENDAILAKLTAWLEGAE